MASWTCLAVSAGCGATPYSSLPPYSLDILMQAALFQKSKSRSLKASSGLDLEVIPCHFYNNLSVLNKPQGQPRSKHEEINSTYR